MTTMLNDVDRQVREIKKVLRSFMGKLQSRDAKEKNALEWRLVALSIDRLFFVIYLLTIVATFGTLILSRYIQPMDPRLLNATYALPDDYLD